MNDINHHPHSTPRYTLLLSDVTRQRLLQYAQSLRAGRAPGGYLAAVLGDNVAPDELVLLLASLFRTRRPQIFAESQVRGDGSDWTLQELGLLGDISVAVPVQVHDDGQHRRPDVHAEPFPATLLFTPGALLRNDQGCVPADWEETARGGELQSQGFVQLYERRLLPVLLHADEVAAQRGRRALVTVPGLGCGMFAGQFQGQVEPHLEAALKELLQRHADRLTHVALIRFDPYKFDHDRQYSAGQTLLRVRSLQCHPDTPQLCPPKAYEESGDDFSDCDLFSVVAWDHVSWPGNDFYAGSRATDDGVKAAATTTMYQMTGIEGRYDAGNFQYRPPEGFRTWGQVIDAHALHLNVSAEQVRVHALR